MKRKLVAILAVLLLLVHIAPEVSHADELTGLTLEKEMRAMIELDVIRGYKDGKVYPKAQVSRADFAAFLARALKLPDTTPQFTDVNTSAAVAGEIGAIQKTGYMTGTLDGKFMPEKLISREEMALTISRVYKAKGHQGEVVNIVIQDAPKFTLGGGLEAAQLLASLKIMNGMPGTLGDNSFIFNPKDISTRDQVAAVLYRYLESNEVPEIPEIPDVENPTPPPVDPEVYQVASIQNGKVVPTVSQYSTYEGALTALGSSNTLRVMLKKNDIIKMKTGRAFGAPNPKNYTSIYEAADLKKEITYVERGREMKHLGSGPNYAIVEVAGTTGYVKHGEIDLVPAELVTGKDYYKNSNGMLIHYTYNNYNNPNNTYGSYSIGPSPAFLKEGLAYYSFDGVRFYDNQNRLVGHEFPYFQYLSARTSTVYTAVQLDSYIMARLADRQALGLARYSNATKNSKLIGLGLKLKELEKTHRVNAMLILATAIHESDFGISAKALSCNNLFGIAAYDSSTKLCERTFTAPEKSAEAFILDYMNKKYINPQGDFPNGAVTGNKTVGLNVKYASDPNWGSKIAGHLWTMDQQLGGLEYKRHMLGRITYYNNADGINVRTTPEVRGDNILFTYKPKKLGADGLFGYPLVILDKVVGSDGATWYKVVADINPVVNGKVTQDFGWVNQDLMTVTIEKK